MNTKNKLKMKEYYKETIINQRNFNSISITVNNGMNIILNVVKMSLKRINNVGDQEKVIYIKRFYKCFESSIKKLFVYVNKYDIIKSTIDGYCSKSELSIQYYSMVQENQVIKIKILFKYIFISLKVIKALEEIYLIFPEPFLGELNKGVSLVLSSLKQIIVLVRIDIRGLVEGVNKKHFNYAFDEFSMQLKHLKFKPFSILSYISN